MSYRDKCSNVWGLCAGTMTVSILGIITADADLVIIASVISVGSLLGYCLYKDCYKQLCDADNELYRYRQKNYTLEMYYEALEERYEDLKQKYAKLLISKKSSNNLYSDDILSAVKYAMQKSHPDNGGKTEDFIKFKKLYDSMKA